MSKLMLKLRDLQSGQGEVKELGSVDEAVKWLGARPAMIEVLGVVFEGLAREDNERMKKAMRPLDDAEKARIEELDEAEKDERERREEARRAEGAAHAAAARAAAKTADPNRPMELRYRFDKPDLEKTDVLVERAITEDRLEDRSDGLRRGADGVGRWPRADDRRGQGHRLSGPRARAGVGTHRRRLLRARHRRPESAELKRLSRRRRG